MHYHFSKDFSIQIDAKTNRRGRSAKKIFDEYRKRNEWADAVIHVGDSDDEGQVLGR